MRFPVYFKRSVTLTNNPVLGTGTDPVPTIATASEKNKDNILSHRLNKPIQRVAVGYWFEPSAAGSPVTLPVEIWVFDETSGFWFKASSGTLTSGALTFLRIPSLADPPQTAANLSQPGHGFDAMIVVADNSGAAGTYHFVAGPDTAQF